MPLEARGWVKARWGQTETSRRARFYELTARGQKQLDREKDEWLRMTAIMASVLE
jgi:DNA-binding PadR family transcriptional regulator